MAGDAVDLVYKRVVLLRHQTNAVRARALGEVDYLRDFLKLQAPIPTHEGNPETASPEDRDEARL